jgi:hypothetical protein
MNPTQLESLNSELLTFFYELFRKQQRAGINNSRKYFVFCIQVGKAWHFILKPKTKIYKTNLNKEKTSERKKGKRNKKRTKKKPNKK